MAIQGLRDTSNFVADQRPQNWRQGVMLLYPNGMAPITALTSMMKEKKTDDPQFNWWEKSFPSQRLAMTGNLANVSTLTTLAFASGAKQYKAGTILRVEKTEELLRVVSDPVSDTQVSVERGFAGSSTAAVTVASENPYVHAVGNAQEEASLSPTGVNYDPTKKYNYTQIFRDTLEMSRTAMQTNLRTGDQVKEAKRETLELHTIGMEKAFIFGKRYEGTLNGKPFRATGGIISQIDSGNIVSAGTTTTMLALEGFLKSIFDYGSSEKMAFCGNKALLVIQQIVRRNSSMQIEPGIKEYGMNVTRLVCPFGTIVLKSHPLFNQLGGSTSPAYDGTDSWMLVLDMKELVYRYIQDTKYEKDLQSNGMDGMKSGYLTEAGLELHHPTAHYLIKGFRAAAVDS